MRTTKYGKDVDTIVTTWSDTREALRTELGGEAATPETLEALRRITSPDRHMRRVEHARAEVVERARKCEAIYPTLPPPPQENTGAWWADQAATDRRLDSARANAWFAAQCGSMVPVDGDRKALRPSSTLRHPFLRDLGKGRKLASDGQAWDAAIREAFPPADGSVSVAQDGAISVVIRAHDHHPPVVLVPNPETGMAMAEFIYRMMETIMMARRYNPNPGDNLAAWARAWNRALEASRQPRAEHRTSSEPEFSATIAYYQTEPAEVVELQELQVLEQEALASE